uniref:NADH-ubiquinone oxidoreductase chain 6 n=1 Tax=Anaplecta omei TaxID=2093429 RepID=A0A2P1H6S6_9NEOP|nr:NADH dehydrogenase subunit 6 [Anaplecta omei]
MMMTLMTSMSIMFSMMNHPLAMGMLLLTQTTLMCMISGLMLKTFWFSYILFLVFLGGMLVLFIYVTTLASNEMFKFSSKLLLLLMTSFMLMTLTWNKCHDTEMLSTWTETSINITNLTTENTKILMKLYNKPTMVITIMMAIYMLLTLIVVVKITAISKGPLRSSS